MSAIGSPLTGPLGTYGPHSLALLFAAEKPNRLVFDLLAALLANAKLLVPFLGRVPEPPPPHALEEDDDDEDDAAADHP